MIRVGRIAPDKGASMGCKGGDSRAPGISRAGLTGALLLAAGPVSVVADAASRTPAPDSAVREIIVTAQRRSETVQAVPISIQALTGKALMDLGIKSSTDLAQFTPNVEIALPNGEGNQPIIAIRGIGLNDYDTNNAGPNGVYLDEVYLSSPAAQTFQTFDLDRVEVLKGPQGTLYGRNASGGAINFVSVKPGDTATASFHLEGGAYDTVNIQGAAGGPLSPRLDGRIAFSVNESGGYFHNILSGTHENGANNFAARGAILYKPTDQLKVLINIHGGEVDNRPTEYRHIADLNPATGQKCGVAMTNAGDCVDLYGYGTPSDFYGGAFNRREPLRISSVGGYVRIDDATGPVDLTSISAVEYSDKLHPEDTDASPYQMLEIDYGVKSTTVTQELRVARTRARYNWVAGAYYLHEWLAQDQPLNALLDIDAIFGAGAGDGVAFKAYDTSRQTTDAYAVFGQGEVAITDQLKLTIGGRYTDESKGFDYHGAIQYQMGGEGNFGPTTTLADSSQSQSDSAFSWRVGLTYQLAPRIMAYGSVATGFKSGDFNGSFLSTNAAEIGRQLKPVGPEHVTAYEVGVKSSFLDRRLVVDVAGFYNDYRDMQIFVFVPPVAGGTGFAVDVLDNAQRAHTDGADIQISGRPAGGLTATALIGVLETRLDAYVTSRDPSQTDYSGNQLPLAPHVSASLILDYRHALAAGAVDLQLSANYKGHAFFDISNSPYLDQSGYWIENLRAAYSFAHGHWEAAVFVRNLSGQKYFVDKFDLTNPFGFIQGVVGQPRFIGGELNYRF
jgi:iron complex outermembrane receptor protein